MKTKEITVKKGHPIKHTLSDKIFLTLNWIVLTAFLIIIAYPLIFVITASFSSGTSIMSLSLLPQNPSLTGYETVFKYRDIWTGYGNSLIYMIAGTVVSLIVTTMCAYPLSRPDFKGRGFIMILCMITVSGRRKFLRAERQAQKEAEGLIWEAGELPDMSDRWNRQ